MKTAQFLHRGREGILSVSISLSYLQFRIFMPSIELLKRLTKQTKNCEMYLPVEGLSHNVCKI